MSPVAMAAAGLALLAQGLAQEIVSAPECGPVRTLDGGSEAVAYVVDRVLAEEGHALTLAPGPDAAQRAAMQVCLEHLGLGVEWTPPDHGLRVWIPPEPGQ